MFEIKRKIADEIYTFKIYTRKEAVEKGFVIKDWSLCIAGDWGLTTDGYVTKCMGLRLISYQKFRPKGGRPNIILFEGGCEFLNSKTFNFMDKKRSNNFDSPCILDRAESFLSDPVVKSVVQFAIFQKTMNGFISDEDLARLVSPYAGETSINEIKSILKRREAQEVIRDETRAILEKKGITPERVIDKYLDIEERAREQDKLEVEMKINDKFAVLIGMTEKPKGELLDPSKEVKEANVIDTKIAKQIEDAKRLEGLDEKGE